MSDWFDHRLETDPRFLDRIAAARATLRAGHGVRLEELLTTYARRTKRRSSVVPRGELGLSTPSRKYDGVS